MEHKKCKYNCLAKAHRIGLLLFLIFALSFFWYYALEGANQALYLQLLQVSFWGFEGIDFKSFIVAAIQSYIAGYILVGLWILTGLCPFYKMLNKKK